MSRPNDRQVLDCASPLALFDLVRGHKSGRGLPQSKTLSRRRTSSAVHTVLSFVIEYFSRANFVQRRHGKVLKALQTAQAARPLGVRIFRYGSMQRSRSWLHWQSK